MAWSRVARSVSRISRGPHSARQAGLRDLPEERRSPPSVGSTRTHGGRRTSQVTGSAHQAHAGRHPRIAIIGAGFGGLAAAIELRKHGFDADVFERADTVGGVWQANTYPGAACDVPSSIYSYSFALDT